jgi:SAM-dependent methyltransferase
MKNTIELNLFRCPTCNADLENQNNGKLDCLNVSCDQSYIVKNNILTFIESTPFSGKGFEYQWLRRGQGDFESETLYGKTSGVEYEQFFNHLEIDFKDIDGKYILDAGCGSARMLDILSKRHVAKFYGIDLSSSLYNNNCEDINLVRGSLMKIPFKENTFDFIWSGGVLHHTPSPKIAFANLVRLLKPQGKIYIWLYSIDQGIFGKIRNFFPKSYKLPYRILYFICQLLALPIYLGGIIFRDYHSFSEIKFKLFDHLSPEFRSVHDEKEIVEWFKSSKLINIKVIINQETGGLGVLGQKR